MRRVFLFTIAAIAAGAFGLVAAGAAMAAPGSAVDEYQEHVPGGGNDKPSDEIGPGGSGGDGSGSSLPPGVVGALEQQGPSGVAAANLAEATAPDRGKGGAGQGSTSASDSGGSDSGDDGGGLGGLLDVILGDTSSSSDDGMGLVLPLILGLSALAAVLFFIGRRRGQSMTRDA